MKLFFCFFILFPKSSLDKILKFFLTPQEQRYTFFIFLCIYLITHITKCPFSKYCRLNIWILSDGSYCFSQQLYVSCNTWRDSYIFFPDHNLKELLFCDTFDSLPCADNSSVCIFIPVSSSSPAFLSALLTSSVGMLIYLSLHYFWTFNAVSHLCNMQKFFSLFHICCLIITRILKNLYICVFQLITTFSLFPPLPTVLGVKMTK